MTLQEISKAAEDFARQHISEIAREIITWQQTAVLCDGKLREVARIWGQLDCNVNTLDFAENTANKVALEILASTAQDAQAEPAVTEEMITAYLDANNRYWKETDDLDRPINKWRNGTPSEATRVSLQAALRAARTQPATPAQDAAATVPGDGQDGDSWESNVAYLLSSCPYTVRQRPGGGPEDLKSTLVVTFRGMQMRLQGDPMFSKSAAPTAQAAPQAAIKEEPLRKLLEYAETAIDHGYGTLSTDFVIKLVKEALGEA